MLLQQMCRQTYVIERVANVMSENRQKPGIVPRYRVLMVLQYFRNRLIDGLVEADCFGDIALSTVLLP